MRPQPNIEGCTRNLNTPKLKLYASEWWQCCFALFFLRIYFPQLTLIKLYKISTKSNSIYTLEIILNRSCEINSAKAKN